MSSTTVLATITEIIYFRLKPSVKPEEAAAEGTHSEGAAFLDLLFRTTERNGHLSSAWGRTEEDANSVVWVIEWADSSASARIDDLQPFIDPSSPEIINFFAILNPPISTTDTLTKNPVTELVTLAVPSNLTPSEQKKWHEGSVAFRSALLEKIPQEDIRPLSWSMGYVERPATFEHPQSPTGHAFIYVSAIGWGSVEKHYAARETKEFADAIKPLREKMLLPAKGLAMKHVRFRKIK
ncbi:hypothetical protein VTN77DRAFT_6511 [Rasamsonia byssochlamydoides]|uniref:uncharacterized protein n=1 Tax=Rasamsonia byssochlamydoides TaxID=89139 RepID=UPI003743384E